MFLNKNFFIHNILPLAGIGKKDNKDPRVSIGYGFDLKGRLEVGRSTH